MRRPNHHAEARKNRGRHDVIDQRIPAIVVQQWLVPRGINVTHTVAEGMSGARIHRCSNPGGTQFSLRRWPQGTARTRVHEVHRVVTHSRDQGCEIVPRLQASGASEDQELKSVPTVVSVGSDHWELSQWMPGDPLAVTATLDQIRRGAAAIASFHRSVRGLGTTLQRPPAALLRISRAGELDRLLPQLLDHPTPRIGDSPELSAAIDRAIRLLRPNWSEVSRRISRSMSRYASGNVQTQYVLRDVHRQHVLFDKQVVSGLIDFDAIRVDTPMTDLARWVGGFLDGSRPGVWDVAMAGYHENSPFSKERDIPSQEGLARELCYATTWIGLANWVVWVVAEKRPFPGGSRRVAARIDELIRLTAP